MVLLQILWIVSAVSALDSWDDFNGVARVTNAAHEVLFQKEYRACWIQVLSDLSVRENLEPFWTQTGFDPFRNP